MKIIGVLCWNVLFLLPSMQITGTWSATVAKNLICISFQQRIDGVSEVWREQQCYKREEIAGVLKDGNFEIRRPAGVLAFQGKMQGGKGRGDHTFTADEAFRQFLVDQGFEDVDEVILLKAFIANLDRSFLQFLKERKMDLVKAGLKALVESKINKHILLQQEKVFRDMGYSNLSLADHMLIHEQALSKTFVLQMEQLGFSQIPVTTLALFRKRGIDLAYVKSIQNTGLTNLQVDDFPRLKAAGVEDGFIRKVMQVQGASVTVDQVLAQKK